MTNCTAFLDGVGHYCVIDVVDPYCYFASEGLVVVILKDNTTIPVLDNTIFPTKGTYFLSGPDIVGTITGFLIGKTTVPEITWDGQTTKLKKLDEKFIPSRIIGIINSDLTFTADPSFDPSTMSVSDALASGKDLLYKKNNEDKGTILKCIYWHAYDNGTVDDFSHARVGFHNTSSGADITLEWTTLDDGTVSIVEVRTGIQ